MPSGGTILSVVCSAAVTFACLALAAVAWTQVPDPPAELSKLDMLLGNWEGSGTARERPGAEPVRWISLSQVRKNLGGHSIQQDLKLEIGDILPAPIVIRNCSGRARGP